MRPTVTISDRHTNTATRIINAAYQATSVPFYNDAWDAATTIPGTAATTTVSPHTPSWNHPR